MPKTTRKTAGQAAQLHKLELTLRVPGLEELLVKLAEHELAREDRTSNRDDEIRRRELQLEGERLALQRLEIEQRCREWQLEKAEREARLAARGKDLGL